ncbi:hypothetical protein [Haloarchaeobius amylolyticus]|uniref:hypothetical protein n=1 Tax=Haloarchaeobius amylolyticus TaxID=1198296 RepID=UPI00226E8289|nr:hypothetical protein [Haloarchaeobius amylolyticus]
MALEYRQTTDPCGIEVLDPLAQVSVQFETSGNQFSPGPTDVPFWDLVDETIELETDHVEFSSQFVLHVFNEEMEQLRQRFGKEQFTLPFGTYVINFPSPVKMYLMVTGQPDIRGGVGYTRVEFQDRRQVVIGFRSNHSEPMATIQTPDRPEDMATAISALGGSFSTTSPDRSWAGLRDYPPKLELGPTLSIPDEIETRETDIDVIVPPRYGALFTAAPLTYYLSGRLRSGPEPAIVAGDEHVDIGVERSLEDDLVRLQRQMFFLDCVVRSIGVYQHDPILDEATISELPFDLDWAYDATPAERLQAYLQVEFTDIEADMPRIPMVAHLPPRPESVTVLPHVLHRLGAVRPARGRPTKPVSSTISAFTRDFESPFSSGTVNDIQDQSYVELSAPDDAVTQAWFGPGIPTNASKATQASLEHGLDIDNEKDSIKVAMVCTDESMLPARDALDDLYDKDRGINREIVRLFDPDRAKLRSVLADDQYDLLHFIGHANRAGLHCRDGVLDVGDLARVGPDLFVLNACETYHQARSLVEQGAVAGVTTHSRVANRDANIIGRNISRLLSEGFSMSAAVEQATMHLDSRSQYLVVGDGLSRFSIRGDVTPTVVTVNLRDEDSAVLSVKTYLWEPHKVGTVTMNCVYAEDETETEWMDTIFDPGETSTYTIDRVRLPKAVMEFGDSETGPPLWVAGELHWPESESDVERLLKE